MLPAAVPLVGVTELTAVGVRVAGVIVESALNAIAVAGTKILQSTFLPRQGVSTKNIHFLPKHYSW